MRDFLRRPHTVLDDAGAHHIVMSFRDFKNSRRLRDMTDFKVDTGLFDFRKGLLEFLKLSLRVRLVFAIGHGKVREHAFNLDIRQFLDSRCQSTDFFRTDADAPHARLDFKMDLRSLILTDSLF